MSSEFSQALGLSNLLNLPFGKIIESGFLSKAEAAILFKLIRNRRSLPVYRGDVWACYECAFRCERLEAMARHIMLMHESAPLTDEEILESKELEV